jgi:SAM-dependent methyltransferase
MPDRDLLKKEKTIADARWAMIVLFSIARSYMIRFTALKSTRMSAIGYGAWSEYVPRAKTLLDVACGTGEHARLLRSDYAVDGVDINETYLRSAQLKNPDSKFSRADMTNFNLGRIYDVVSCLFCAIGIVETYEQLEHPIFCMARHVRPGGVLIVEPWFTPERWHPGEPFILVAELNGKKVYRLSMSRREGLRSVLLHHYMRGIPYGIERHDERIELSLFTRDEMTWTYEFGGMDVRYESEGLMGRGL